MDPIFDQEVTLKFFEKAENQDVLRQFLKLPPFTFGESVLKDDSRELVEIETEMSFYLVQARDDSPWGKGI